MIRCSKQAVYGLLDLHNCTLLWQYKANEVLLREGEVETVSCAVFIRKAFVTSILILTMCCIVQNHTGLQAG